MNTTPDPKAPKLDPEPWLDPLTAGDAVPVRWATVDRVGRAFYDFTPRPEFSQNRKDYPNA